MPPTPMKSQISYLLTSTLKPYSGGEPTRKTTMSSLKDQPLSDMDSKSLTKKELQIEAGGAHLMEPQMKMSPLK